MSNHILILKKFRRKKKLFTVKATTKMRKKIFFNRSTRSKTWKCVSSKKKGREISFDSRGEKMVGGDRS
jgi:hypothetical protein